MERLPSSTDRPVNLGCSPCPRSHASAIKARTWVTSVFSKSVGSQLRLSQNDLLVELAADLQLSNAIKPARQVSPVCSSPWPKSGLSSGSRRRPSLLDYRDNMLTDRDLDLLGHSSSVDEELDQESSISSSYIDCDYHHGYSHDIASAIGEYSELLSEVEMKIRRQPWSNVVSDVTDMMSSTNLLSSSHLLGAESEGEEVGPFPMAQESHDCLDEFNPLYECHRSTPRRSSPPLIPSMPEPTYRWIGKLPSIELVNPTFSTKVFLGGLPRGISENDIINTFKRFGEVKLSWPKEKFYHRHFRSIQGFIYLRFESDKNVKAVLRSCSRSETNPSEWYYPIQWDGFKKKGVQVIPWQTRDNTYSENCIPRLDSRKTVFVGALHGRLTARALYCIMNDLFHNAVYVGLDTDMNKYPIGSGRVTFSTEESFMKAVTCGFVGIDTPEFSKVIQIDPYLEDSECGMCEADLGPYFCRDLTCFGYYCERCWKVQHNLPSVFHHKPLTRKLDH